MKPLKNLCWPPSKKWCLDKILERAPEILYVDGPSSGQREILSITCDGVLMWKKKEETDV